MNEVHQASDRLKYLCETLPNKLNLIPSSEWLAKPNPDKWSKQEILGHLIDSATNNHQRFVRIQFEDQPNIYYNQNEWVSYSYHQKMELSLLIDAWRAQNLHLAAIMRQIPESAYVRTGFANGKEHITLSYFMIDYVAHLEHHLKQIFED